MDGCSEFSGGGLLVRLSLLAHDAFSFSFSFII
jgi:hypothetical protein